MNRSLPQPRRTTTENLGSDPTTVLQRLIILRDNLEAALSTSRQTTASGRREPDADTSKLPFVTRWVDYSRKHGVGYVLNDGTVGCIINASTKNSTPVTHVLVRNGQRWLSKTGKTGEGVENVPVEIFEDRGKAGVQPTMRNGISTIDPDRRRTLGILWVKFGRYMCQSLDGEEQTDHNSSQLVRFYQRLGNVGVWAFVDGSLQVCV